MRSKELRASRAKLIEDARTLLDSEPIHAAETHTKFEAMMDEADGLKVQIDRIEADDARISSQLEDVYRARNAGADRRGPDEQLDEKALEDKAFMSFVRYGMSGLSEDERRVAMRRQAAVNTTGLRAALGTVPDTAGGYTLPDAPMMRLVDAQKAYGGMMLVSNVFDSDNGNALPIPTDNDTSNSGAILSENTQVGQQDTTFGVVMMNGYTYTSKLVLASNQLLQDTAFPLDTWLMEKLGIRIARATNAHFTTGSGAAQPTGVITASTLGYTAGGTTTSGETTTVVSDDLIELEHSVDPAYRPNARFMMSNSMLKVLKKLKDGLGRQLWLPGLATKEPDTINSYPYVINQDMPVPAASAKTMLFGDFMNYYIRRIVGVQLLRLTERYADFNQVGFLAFQRWDGQLVDAGTHPVKYLQQSAT